MYRTIQLSLKARIDAILRAKYDIALAQLAVEQPPNIALGELALAGCVLKLAKRLRKAPRAIATELATELAAELPGGCCERRSRGRRLPQYPARPRGCCPADPADEHADIGGPGFRLVEHTSINPNKAAHIGHLRKCDSGDSFQRAAAAGLV